jgi:hypothetical protein
MLRDLHEPGVDARKAIGGGEDRHLPRESRLVVAPGIGGLEGIERHTGFAKLADPTAGEPGVSCVVCLGDWHRFGVFSVQMCAFYYF